MLVREEGNSIIKIFTYYENVKLFIEKRQIVRALLRLESRMDFVAGLHQIVQASLKIVNLLSDSRSMILNFFSSFLL